MVSQTLKRYSALGNQCKTQKCIRNAASVLWFPVYFLWFTISHWTAALFRPRRPRACVGPRLARRLRMGCHDQCRPNSKLRSTALGEPEIVVLTVGPVVRPGSWTDLFTTPGPSFCRYRSFIARCSPYYILDSTPVPGWRSEFAELEYGW